MSGSPPPRRLWLGMVDGQWPVQAFTDELHAIYWMGHPEDAEGQRRVWTAEVTVGVEMVLEEPKPYLRPAGAEQ